MILFEIVAQGDLQKRTLADVLGQALAGRDFDRLDVAVAYATRSGIRSLEKAAGGWPAITRWVVGLDDLITQPEAIDDLISLNPAEIRLASLATQRRRFHPKLYCFWSSSDESACVAMVGSANMTLHGLTKNGETGVFLVAECPEDVERLKASWAEMSALGEDIAVVDLAAYREAHKKARKIQRRLARIGAVPDIPEADESLSVFDGDPTTASVAWTEGASPSAGGRDLEFAKPMMPFFGLGPSPVVQRFRMVNGDWFSLTFTERLNNHMWRLLFSRESIQAAVGRDSLRPLSGIERSDLAIVFRKAVGLANYDVEMVVIGSPAHAALLAQSQAVGGLKRTRDPGGRNYGFY